MEASQPSHGVRVQGTGTTSAVTGTAMGTTTPQPTTTTTTKEEVGWRRIVRNFTPSWFAVNMGTGIVSILLHSLPYTTPWLPYLSYVFFAFNVCLFLVFTAVTAARYLLYPEIWTAMLNHPGQSLFLGTFPMGLASECCPFSYTSITSLLSHLPKRAPDRPLPSSSLSPFPATILRYLPAACT